MSGMTVPCNRCGGTLRFIKTRAGKAMPVEPVPDDTGNVAALKTTTGRYIDAHVIKPSEHDKARADGFTIFLPHYAVCRPQPKQTPGSDAPSLF